jgi:hypothetical protein
MEHLNRNVLKTRPVSSTFPPTAVPDIRDSRMEETSDAAACAVLQTMKVGEAGNKTRGRVDRKVHQDARKYIAHQVLRSRRSGTSMPL